MLAHLQSDYIIIAIIDRLLLQDLLYALPDMKTQETPSGKNWERITQPNATAQTLGVWGVNYWVKLWSIHFERWSIELNTVQPLILVKNLCNNRTIIRVPYIYVITNCNQSRPILLTSNFYNIVVSNTDEESSSISYHHII